MNDAKNLEHIQIDDELSTILTRMKLTACQAIDNAETLADVVRLVRSGYSQYEQDLVKLMCDDYRALMPGAVIIEHDGVSYTVSQSVAYLGKIASGLARDIEIWVEERNSSTVWNRYECVARIEFERHSFGQPETVHWWPGMGTNARELKIDGLPTATLTDIHPLARYVIEHHEEYSIRSRQSVGPWQPKTDGEAQDLFNRAYRPQQTSQE